MNWGISTYYVVYMWRMHVYEDHMVEEDITIRVRSPNMETYELTIPPDSLNGYQSVLTLDVNQKEIHPARSNLRTMIMVINRLIITLILESVVFFLFQYRNRRSWICFLLINITTQLLLSLFLLHSSWITHFYIRSIDMAVILVAEVFIVFIEVVTCLLCIREHRKRRVILCVILSNMISYMIGSAFLMHLPI